MNALLSKYATFNVLYEYCLRLRWAGIALSSSRIETFLRGVLVVRPQSLREIYWTGRISLVSSPAEIAIYDRIFQEFFREFSETKELVSLAAKPRTDFSEPPASGQEIESELSSLQVSAGGRCASELGSKTIKVFSPLTEKEQRQLNRIQELLRDSVPERRTRRFRSGGKRSVVDPQKTLRSSYRTGGILTRLVYKEARRRPRRLTLLVDVSGSMKSLTRAYLGFAWAAARSAAQLEVFCVGTRLSRVTGLLREQDADLALQEVGRQVLDFDGGTRLSLSISMLLNDRRHLNFVRGSLLILFSDGLERGGSAALRQVAQRLSRLVHKIIWVNPLAADPRFEPAAAGVKALAGVATQMVGFTTLEQLSGMARTFANIQQKTAWPSHAALT
jgi:uncharacterized protein with von Willebrand factor type A (vWA) domain